MDGSQSSLPRIRTIGPLLAILLVACGSSGDGADGGAGGGAPVIRCDLPGYVPAGPDADWFDDVTATSGINASSMGKFTPGSGVAIDDIDGDGLFDVVVAGDESPTVVYRNAGDMKFEDVTSQVSDAPLAVGLGVQLADLDGDGDQDLIVTGQSTVVVYENAGGKFADRTATLGIAPDIARSVGALAGDLDGDGLLDLYILNDQGNRLLHNQGSFVFDDVTAAAGVSVFGQLWTGALWDHDADGKLDIYVQVHNGITDPVVDDQPTDGTGDRLFRNIGSGGALLFTDVAADAGLAKPRSSMGAAFADFDGDGALDVYVSNFGRKPLFLQGAGHQFTDAADELGAGATRFEDADCPADAQDRECLLSAWGSAAFDADHDGVEDLVLVNGFPGSSFGVQPATTLRGRAEGGFAAVETSMGCFDGRSLVAADLDGDGDLDVVATTVGGPVRVFQSRAPAGRGWLRVKLAGKGANRHGVGAVVTATLPGGRKMMRAIGPGGVIFASAPPEAHFVTGGGAFEALDIRWPSGALQHLSDVPVDQVLTVVEP